MASAPSSPYRSRVCQIEGPGCDCNTVKAAGGCVPPKIAIALVRGDASATLLRSRVTRKAIVGLCSTPANVAPAFRAFASAQANAKAQHPRLLHLGLTQLTQLSYVNTSTHIDLPESSSLVATAATSAKTVKPEAPSIRSRALRRSRIHHVDTNAGGNEACALAAGTHSFWPAGTHAVALSSRHATRIHALLQRGARSLLPSRPALVATTRQKVTCHHGYDGASDNGVAQF